MSWNMGLIAEAKQGGQGVREDLHEHGAAELACDLLGGKRCNGSRLQEIESAVGVSPLYVLRRLVVTFDLVAQRHQAGDLLIRQRLGRLLCCRDRHRLRAAGWVWNARVLLMRSVD